MKGQIRALKIAVPLMIMLFKTRVTGRQELLFSHWHIIRTLYFLIRYPVSTTDIGLGNVKKL